MSGTCAPIFQFPPPRGGEQATPCAGPRRADFNSRPREGANLGAFTLLLPLSRFQFPPPRGGEHGITIHRRRPKLFQFPPPRGGEQYGVTVLGIGFISIPAPARGRTRRVSTCRWPKSDFNSRPREGANGRFIISPRPPSLFQFPPPRGGERGLLCVPELICLISIPAPARGRTAKLHKIEQSILSVC